MIPRAILIAAALLGGLSSLGDARQAAPPPYAQLVRQLGSPSFRVRESAAYGLQQAGLAAKPALLLGLKDPDLEIRMEAHRLLTQILEQDFERKLASFLKDGDPQVAAELPAWKRFSVWLGRERKQRALYVDMLRHELPLLSGLDHMKDADGLRHALLERFKELTSTSQPDGSRENISPASVATLLFVTAQPEMEADSIIEARVYLLLSKSTIKHYLLVGPQSVMLLQLVDKWLVHAIKDRPSYYALRITLAFNRKQIGAKLGRAALANAESVASVLGYAAIAVAKFGGREDIGCLVPHLDNTTVCHTWSNTRLKKEPIRIEVRDIVLAMLIRMTGQDPKEYGFKLLVPDPDTIYRIYTFGFLSDEERDQTLDKWHKWYSTHGTQPSRATESARKAKSVP